MGHQRTPLSRARRRIEERAKADQTGVKQAGVKQTGVVAGPSAAAGS